MNEACMQEYGDNEAEPLVWRRGVCVRLVTEPTELVDLALIGRVVQVSGSGVRTWPLDDVV